MGMSFRNFMISFLSEKQVDYSNIEKILSASKNENHYTNNGPVKRSLESHLEKSLQIDSSKRIVCCSNGTSALHSILYLCGERGGNVDFGGDWIIPALTFPSCVVGMGSEFRMHVEDIDPATNTLPLDAETLMGYDGVIITNLFGSYVDLPAWTKLCKEEGKILIFDNAASPLSTYDDTNICNFGDYSFGSLHHTKYFGFGEGGLIVCPKEDYDVLNSITSFGYFYGKTGPRQFKRWSSNFKMSDVSAAFILSHIQTYDIDKHLENQNKLIDGLSKVSAADPFNYKPGTVYNTFPVLFRRKADTLYFMKQGIKAHKYYEPLVDLPFSNDLYDRIINFPLYADLSEEQLKYMVKMINSSPGNGHGLLR